jgi:hypothetical protein
VRQDFIVCERPAGTGALRVGLAVEGAKAQAMPDGARLVLTGSGRVLAYNHLRVADARGRELKARMQAISPAHLAVVVNDAVATYPVRIDPTFSDANWVSLGGGLGGTSGAGGSINALAADTNGNVYAGGEFTMLGTAFATNIARWNGTNWTALGSGVQFTVTALACDDSGNLYAGGGLRVGFDGEIGVISKWDGNVWSDLGSVEGPSSPYSVGTVSALAVDDFGNLYVGGGFTTAGGVSAINMAKWDGMAWAALGAGVGTWHAGALALACDKSGNLYAGGTFTNAGGVSATNIARWDGSAWSALGSGIGDTNAAVYALACDTKGNLCAGGYFRTAGGVTANSVAKWDGRSWSDLGVGMDGGVSALAFDSSGHLYASGSFDTAGGVSATIIAEWDGSTWSALGPGIGALVGGGIPPFTWGTLALDASGKLYVMAAIGGAGANGVLEWDGVAWSSLGTVAVGSSWGEVGGGVNALAFDRNGDLYAGGSFFDAGDAPANDIAKWDGKAWSALGLGAAWGNVWGGVYALAFETNGNLYVGGNFTIAGGVAANNIAKWDGSSWSALGSGIGDESSAVGALAFDANGNLYAGGGFSSAGGVSADNIAKWDGIAWSALGSGVDGYVSALAFDSDGDLCAGEWSFTAAKHWAGNVAKWDGGAWSNLGSGMNNGPYQMVSVNALVSDGNGNLYAGGAFSEAGGVSVNNIAKWDGSSWSALSSGIGNDDSAVGALALDAKGNLWAGGGFSTAGGASANNIAKWDGIAWSALGSGVDGGVSALAFDTSGNLYLGGAFTSAGTNVSVNVAKALLTGPTPNQLLLTNFGTGTNILTYLGTPGSNYALDLASSLTPPVNWVPQATNTASTANATTAGYLTFTNSNHLPQAYYRTRHVP